VKHLNYLGNISPEMPTLILHIGGAKCGSSALQTFLTQNPNLKTVRNQEIEYWRVFPDKEEPKNFKFAPVLVEQSNSNKTGYINSSFPIFSNKCLHGVFARFIEENSIDANKVFVFSHEGWSGECQLSEAPECTCENTNYRTVVYLSVRPQMQMLIPAYLQWILWSDKDTLADALNFLKKISDWSKQIHNSYKFGADEVISVFTQDIVESFSETFSLDKGSIINPLNRKINTSLPIEALVLLLRNRELRPGAHHGGIDFVLEKLIQKFEIPTNSVELIVPGEIVAAIDEFFTSSNAQLKDFLTENQVIDFNKKYVEAREKLLQNKGIRNISEEKLDYVFLEKLVVALLTVYE